MRRLRWYILGLLVFLLVTSLLVQVTIGPSKAYSYMFSRRVHGVVIDVKKVNDAMAIMGGAQVNTTQLFSFAVAIKESSGEIAVASSEDRQWAVVSAGKCAEAVYFPYPPWNLEKADTYYGARLIKLYDCPEGAAAIEATSPPEQNETPPATNPPPKVEDIPQSK
jgi:hypothetical protein